MHGRSCILVGGRLEGVPCLSCKKRTLCHPRFPFFEVQTETPRRPIFAPDPNADPVRAESNDMLTLADIQELLGLEVLGLIPESKAVLTATNLGRPVIMAEGD